MLHRRRSANGPRRRVRGPRRSAPIQVISSANSTVASESEMGAPQLRRQRRIPRRSRNPRRSHNRSPRRCPPHNRHVRRARSSSNRCSRHHRPHRLLSRPNGSAEVIGIGGSGFVPLHPSHTTGHAGPHPAVRWFSDRPGEERPAGRGMKSAARFEGHRVQPSPTTVEHGPRPLVPRDPAPAEHVVHDRP